MRKFFPALILVAALAACSPSAPATSASDEQGVHAAHEAYVTAINTNDVNAIMALVTDDIVYLPPNGPALSGTAAVRPWLEGYVAAYRTHWEKTTVELIVSGDWAIEHYAYQSTDTPIAGGAAVTDTGKGVNIYCRQADGSWRVARDIWNSDRPLAP